MECCHGMAPGKEHQVLMHGSQGWGNPCASFEHTLHGIEAWAIKGSNTEAEACRNEAIRGEALYLSCLKILLVPGNANIVAIVHVLVHVLQEVGCRDLCQHGSEASAFPTHGCKPSALIGILIPAVVGGEGKTSCWLCHQSRNLISYRSHGGCWVLGYQPLQSRSRAAVCPMCTEGSQGSGNTRLM